MINNRQNGRRRGRGGQRPGGGNPGQPGGNGNRIDNRARGNANQLYEKYKGLAADAQRQGDRVNTEYYLQFADHYFRVLSENRPRFEEQQRRGRDEFDDEGDGDGEEFGMEGEPARADQYQGRRDRDERREPREQRAEGAEGGERAERQRPDRQERGERQERGDRPQREGRPRNGFPDRSEANGHAIEVAAITPPEPATEESSAPHMADMDAPAPRRRGRPRRERLEEEAMPETFEADRLPPSLSVSASAEPDTAPAGEALDAPERPRRRRRSVAAPAEAAN